jgi:hypothetical protein
VLDARAGRAGEELPMLRIAAAVAALALGWATLELRSLIDVNISATAPRPARVDQVHLPIMPIMRVAEAPPAGS